MAYADGLLSTGERIVHREKQHWWVFVWGARYTILAVVLAAILGWFAANMSQDGISGTARTVLSIIVAVLFFGGLAVLVWTTLRYLNQEYVLTNRRVIQVEGVINKRAVDSSLEKINDAQLDQSVWGRLLNYGHLDILTASTESELDDYDMIRDPKGFKKVMLTQKQALDSGAGYAPPPSPPLRAEGAPPMVQPTTPAAPAPAAPAQAAPAAPGAAAESLEVTQTLARLADLRDRGAISEEEYQAKKQELLDRL
jgi:hypothetical protein